MHLEAMTCLRRVKAELHLVIVSQLKPLRDAIWVALRHDRADAWAWGRIALTKPRRANAMGHSGSAAAPEEEFAGA